MASVDEALSQAAEASASECDFLIDSDLRVISIPKNGVVLGVANDKDVNHVTFKMPRIYRGVDLGGFDVRINYRNASRQMGIYEVADKKATADEITFTWIVGEPVARFKGTVNFIACLRELGSDGQTIEREFNTTLGEAEVLEGLEPTSSIGTQTKTDLVAELKNYATDAANQVIGDLDKVKASAAAFDALGLYIDEDGDICQND